MKCYDFELNISAYIEGELKQGVRQTFNEHKENCRPCKEKLLDISQIMDKMPKLTPYITSPEFIQTLNEKTHAIDNRGPSILKRLKQLRPLGFEPAPALGFSLAIAMVVGASYLLINRDGLPDINMENLSSQAQHQKASKAFKSSVVIPQQTEPSIADSDSSVKSNISNRYNDKIKLTGSK